MVCSSASEGWWMGQSKNCSGLHVESQRYMSHLHGEVIHKLFQTSEKTDKPVKICIILWPFVFQACFCFSLSLSLSLSMWRPRESECLNPKLHNWRPTLMPPLDLNPKVEFNSGWKRIVNNVARVNANKSFRS